MLHSIGIFWYTFKFEQTNKQTVFFGTFTNFLITYVSAGCRPKIVKTWVLNFHVLALELKLVDYLQRNHCFEQGLEMCSAFNNQNLTQAKIVPFVSSVQWSSAMETGEINDMLLAASPRVVREVLERKTCAYPYMQLLLCTFSYGH